MAQHGEAHAVSFKSTVGRRRATGSYRGAIHTLCLPADWLVSREGQVAPGYWPPLRTKSQETPMWGCFCHHGLGSEEKQPQATGWRQSGAPNQWNWTSTTSHLPPVLNRELPFGHRQDAIIPALPPHRQTLFGFKPHVFPETSSHYSHRSLSGGQTELTCREGTKNWVWKYYSQRSPNPLSYHPPSAPRPKLLQMRKARPRETATCPKPWS